MEIKKQLRISLGGNKVTEPNAVLYTDTGVDMIVLKEALLNETLFPLMLESGYKYVGEPYAFEKDGISTEKLPVEDYTPTDTEAERIQ